MIAFSFNRTCFSKLKCNQVFLILLHELFRNIHTNYNLLFSSNVQKLF